MKEYIYADNAATTKLDIDAFEAMKPWLLDAFGNASQPYSFAREPKKALAKARAIVAACIGADPEEVYFTSGGSESDNWVIKGSALTDSEKRATITSAFEHHAILNSCAAIEQIGYPVAYLMPSPEGQVHPDILARVITGNTRLVSIMYANNEIGAVQPIKELCDVAHSHGALFHSDAVQAVGHVEIDVHALGLDYLSASAHKFNGPKGVGFLYMRKGCELKPLINGGAQERGYRAGTENIASIMGMAAALKKNCETMDKTRKHLVALENQLCQGLHENHIDFIKNGGEYTLPGLVSLSFRGKDGEAILHRMDLMGIAISTGSACDSVNTEISHVLKAINMDEAYAKGTIRISLGKNNSLEEVNRIVKSLVSILDR